MISASISAAEQRVVAAPAQTAILPRESISKCHTAKRCRLLVPPKATFTAPLTVTRLIKTCSFVVHIVSELCHCQVTRCVLQVIPRAAVGEHLVPVFHTRLMPPCCSFTSISYNSCNRCCHHHQFAAVVAHALILVHCTRITQANAGFTQTQWSTWQCFAKPQTMLHSQLPAKSFTS